MNWQIRLIGGQDNRSGRVEVYYNGQWGTVCGDHWDLKDATVVCRELGFKHALNSSGKAQFGAGNGTIWMNNVECSGKEDSLRLCPFIGWGSHNCSHDKDASVKCGKSLNVKIRAQNLLLQSR